MLYNHSTNYKKEMSTERNDKGRRRRMGVPPVGIENLVSSGRSYKQVKKTQALLPIRTETLQKLQDAFVVTFMREAFSCL